VSLESLQFLLEKLHSVGFAILVYKNCTMRGLQFWSIKNCKKVCNFCQKNCTWVIILIVEFVDVGFEVPNYVRTTLNILCAFIYFPTTYTIYIYTVLPSNKTVGKKFKTITNKNCKEEPIYCFEISLFCQIKKNLKGKIQNKKYKR